MVDTDQNLVHDVLASYSEYDHNLDVRRFKFNMSKFMTRSSTSTQPELVTWVEYTTYQLFHLMKTLDEYRKASEDAKQITTTEIVMECFFTYDIPYKTFVISSEILSKYLVHRSLEQPAFRHLLLTINKTALYAFEQATLSSDGDIDSYLLSTKDLDAYFVKHL